MFIDFHNVFIDGEDVLFIFVNGRLLLLKNKYPIILYPTGEYKGVSQEIPLYRICIILDHYNDLDDVDPEIDLFPLSFKQYTLSEIEIKFLDICNGLRVSI